MVLPKCGNPMCIEIEIADSENIVRYELIKWRMVFEKENYRHFVDYKKGDHYNVNQPSRYNYPFHLMELIGNANDFYVVCICLGVVRIKSENRIVFTIIFTS